MYRYHIVYLLFVAINQNMNFYGYEINDEILTLDVLLPKLENVYDDGRDTKENLKYTLRNFFFKSVYGFS